MNPKPVSRQSITSIQQNLTSKNNFSKDLSPIFPDFETLAQETSKDTLKSIFALQKGLADMMDLSRYPDDTQGRVSALCTAIIHEAVELQMTTNWKWWKKPTRFDEKHAREELIDIWHFVVQASLELGLTPEDILDEYKRKNEINRQRQRDGY